MKARLIPVLLLALGLSGCFKSEVQFETNATVIATDNDSVLGFQRTVYKLAKNSTCINCHANSQSPFFVNKDPFIAHDAVLDAGKVNFQRPELSRLYLRLKNEKHNCWYNGDCERSADEMLQAIYAWREYVKSYEVDLGQITEVKPFLANGLPLQAGEFLFEAEAVNQRVTATTGLGSFSTSDDKAASGGRYVYVPEAGRTADVKDPEFGNALIFPFRAANTSTYTAYLRVASNGDGGDDTLNIGVNNTLVNQFNITNRDNAWHWQLFGTFTVNPGRVNDFMIGVEDDGVKIDQVLLLPNNVSNLISGQSEDALMEKIGRRATIIFDLDPLTERAAAAWNETHPDPDDKITADALELAVTMTIYDEEGYKVESAIIRDKGPNKRANNLLIRGVRWMMNGSFNPQDSDWVTVNKVIPTEALNDSYDTDGDPSTIREPLYNHVSLRPMLVQKDRGPLADRIAIAFEAFEYTDLTPGKIPVPANLTPQETFIKLVQAYCINCHNFDPARTDRTLFVWKDPDTFQLMEDETFQQLEEGGLNFTLNINGSNINYAARAAHVRRSIERMVRPRVNITKGPKIGQVAAGSGFRGSAIWRVWRLKERVPAEMQPFVDGINDGSAKGNTMLTKIEEYITGLPIQNGDDVPPRLEAFTGVSTNIGRDGMNGSNFDFVAFDDVTAIDAVEVSIERRGSAGAYSGTNPIVVDRSTTASSPAGSPILVGFERRFMKADGEGAFAPPVGGDQRTNNYRFTAVAYDESRNASITTRIGNDVVTERGDIQITTGNCDVKFDSVQGSDSSAAIPDNSFTVGQSYPISGYAQNLFGGTTVFAQMSIDNQTATGNNGGIPTARIDLARDFIPDGTNNQTLTIQASNGTAANAAPNVTNPYSCSKQIQLNSSVNLFSQDGGNGDLLIIAEYRSHFTGAVSIDLTETRINDPMVYDADDDAGMVTREVFNGYAGRRLVYRWRAAKRDTNTHTFTVTVNHQGNTTTATINRQ